MITTMKTTNFTRVPKNTHIMRMILLTVVTVFTLQTVYAQDSRAARLAKVLPGIQLNAVSLINTSSPDLRMEELRLKIAEGIAPVVAPDYSPEMALEELRLKIRERLIPVVNGEDSEELALEESKLSGDSQETCLAQSTPDEPETLPSVKPFRTQF